jgi:outer membrane protein OmpA-like peptidoglycan-associated protein
MSIYRLLPSVLLASSLLLIGCSSVQQANPDLEQARSAYGAAQTDSAVATYAPLELKQAADALNVADRAWNERESDDKISQLAYIAKQKAAISQQVARQKSAEAIVADATRQRDQLRLEQRTIEAQAAQDRAARLEARLNELAAKKTDRGMVVTLNDVFFAPNKSQLKPGGLRSVEKLALVLQENPQRTVLIEGYTDNKGSATHNQKLSERRADAVRSALVRRGISTDRIKTQGYGSENPVASNNTPGNRQLNRRVEIVFSDESGNTTSTGGN